MKMMGDVGNPYDMRSGKDGYGNLRRSGSVVPIYAEIEYFASRQKQEIHRPSRASFLR
jgi:hypothetical protein